jgi:hypothetical protein
MWFTICYRQTDREYMHYASGRSWRPIWLQSSQIWLQSSQIWPKLVKLTKKRSARPGGVMANAVKTMLRKRQNVWDIAILIIYIYIYIYIHIHIHIHIHMFLFVGPQSAFCLRESGIYMYIRTYAYVHTYICAYIHTYMLTYMHAYIHAYIHACIHTYMHTYIPHTYTRTLTHTYIYLTDGKSNEDYKKQNEKRNQIPARTSDRQR